MGPCLILRVEFDIRTPTDETHLSLSVPHSVQTGGKGGVIDQEAAVLLMHGTLPQGVKSIHALLQKK